MITATRKLAHELEDGSLEVVLQVHPQHKVAFFNTFPKAGLWVSLAPAEKPYTQGAAPTAAEAPSPPNTAERPGRKDVDSVVRNPWFQQYVDEKSPFMPGEDAEERAKGYINAVGAGLTQAHYGEAMSVLKREFLEWCKRKGYVHA